MSKRLRYILTWFLLTAAVMLTTACGDDTLATESAVPQPAWVGADSVYLNFRIVGNDAAATRATTAQATAAERQVYDGILAIFVGSSEAEAQLKAACAIDQLVATADGSGDAADASIVQRLPNALFAASAYPYGDKHLYALLLLNTTHTGLRVSNGTLYKDNTSLANKTVADLQKLELTSLGSIDDEAGSTDAQPSFHTGLFMSNAPRWEGGAVHILTQLDPDLLKASQTEAAKAANSQSIRVERAAAKIKVEKDASPDIDITLNGNAAAHPSVHRMTWTPDHTARQFYAVRNTIDTDHTTGPWTWDTGDAMNWAYSPNYSGGATLSSFSSDDFNVYQQRALRDGGVAYVMENTTDVAHMTSDHLTRVIIEVQLKDASGVLLGDCFTYSDDNPLTLYTSRAQLLAHLKTAVTHGIADRSADEVFRNFAISIGDGGATTVSLTNPNFTEAEQTALNALATTLSGKIKGFREGRMYYSWKIQHDDTKAAGALGHYGMVRNNYYQLTLNKLPRIGSPTPADPALEEL